MSLGSVQGQGPKPLEYPRARRDPAVVDDYHGTRVADPYRWLEDPDSPETRAWVEAENKVTFAFLESIPGRAKIKERLTKLWNYEKFGIPRKEGARYFWSRNTGLQNQAVYYVAEGLEAEPRVLIDPNTLSSDGTVALAGLSTTQDGSLAAYGIAAAGSDWNEWKVRDVATGKDLDDDLKWIKFSGASWTKDGKGFFYSRFPEPAKGADLKGANYNQKLYYHKLGTPQAADALIYERPDHKEWMFSGEATEDGRYLVITVRKSSAAKNMVLYKDLTTPDARVVELIGDFEDEFNFIDNDGPVFYFQTNKAAARGRVVAIDTTKPEAKDWTEIVPQAAETLESVTLVGDHFIANYLKDAVTQVKLFDLKGKFIREVVFPYPGTASGFGGKREDKETFYVFTSYIAPPMIYRYDIPSGDSRVFKSPNVDFKPADYESHQVFFRSKDGTKIPMVISHKTGLKRDGKNPTLLYAYGGFNISLTPAFSPGDDRLDGDGRRLCRAEPPGRGRIWRGLASGRDQAPEAECLRRLHRRGRVPDRREVHLDAEARDRGPVERRPARRGRDDPASRPLRRGLAGGGGDGHAPIPQVHDRLGLGRRLRLVGPPRAVRRDREVFPAAQPQARHVVSPDDDHDGRPRRPGRPRPQLQVRRRAPGGPQGDQSHPDPDRDPRRPRRRQADGQGHRGGGRSLCVPGQGARDGLISVGAAVRTVFVRSPWKADGPHGGPYESQPTRLPTPWHEWANSAIRWSKRS